MYPFVSEMPRNAKTHEENRMESCACCGGKVVPQHGRRKITAPTGAIVKRIQDFAKPEFSMEVNSFPLGLCEWCRKQLATCAKLKKENKPVPSTYKAKWDSFKLQNINIPRGQLARTCKCDICLARRSRVGVDGFDRFNKKTKIVPRGEGPAKKMPVRKVRGPCRICLQRKIGPGIRHRCGFAARKRNLIKMALDGRPASEQITSAMLKVLVSGKGAKQGEPMRLKQLKGGNLLKVCVGQQKEKKGVQVRSETVAKIKKKLKLSDRAAETLCRILREDNVRVEPGTRKFLGEMDKLLSPFYENRKMMMEVPQMQKVCKTVRVRGGKLAKKLIEKRQIVLKEKDVAIVKDTSEFLAKIAELRNISQEDAFYRVCKDGGGGSFKAVVSVLDRSVDPSREKDGELLSGVNRLLPLAVCPGIPERHHNLRQIMEHLKLHLVPNLKSVMDLCLLNAILGISAHGGKFSCSWCEGPSSLEAGELRTFKHLHQKYQGYQAAGAKPSKMKDFANVTKPCLTVAEPDQLVLEVHPIPELHCTMGVVNHLVKLCASVDSNFLDLLKQQNIFQHGYHGGGLDGNNSLKYI